MNNSMQSASDETYVEFYQRVYGDFVVERRLAEGKESVGMFVCQQPAGCFPDDSMSTYNVQMNLGSPFAGKMDLGAGPFEAPIKRGGFAIAPAQTATTYTLYEQHRLMCLGVPACFFDGAAAEIGVDNNAISALLSSTHSDPVVRQLMKECWAESSNQMVRGTLFLDASLMTIASRILGLAMGRSASVQPGQVAGLSDIEYDRICQYVDSNIDVNLRMKTLARLVGMNYYRFTRAFKARTGVSPYQWVIDRRLSRAEQLLSKSAMPIAEVAFATGFSSQSHMTALFRMRMGTTPAEIRN